MLNYAKDFSHCKINKKHRIERDCVGLAESAHILGLAWPSVYRVAPAYPTKMVTLVSLSSIVYDTKNVQSLFSFRRCDTATTAMVPYM